MSASEKESQKDKGKRLSQACGACRKRKVVLNEVDMWAELMWRIGQMFGR